MTALFRFLLEPWKLIYQSRNVIVALYVSDLRGRFAAGNVLGWAWLVLYPLLFVACYSLVYIGLLATRSPDLDPTANVLLIFVGFVPWWGISETLAAGTSLVHSNVSLLKNNLFPLELLAVRTTIVAMTQAVLSLGVVLLGYLFFAHWTLSFVQIPLLLALLIVGCVGVSWISACLGAFFRDLSYAVNILLMLMMIISPIGYTEDLSTGALRTVLTYNPVTYVIRAFRESISLGHWLDVGLVCWLSVGVLVLFYAGYYLYSRLKVMFADLV